MRTITLPIFGIVVEISENNSNATISSTDLKTVNNDTEDELYNSAIDGLESMILACACSGIDIETPQFLEAIESSVQAISNNF